MDTEQTARQPAAAKPRVMIVEDDFLIRLTLGEVLADEGYDVLEADSGDQALELLATAGNIAVLLTDVQLPGKLDGLALAQHARTARPTLPVIFMTGRPDVLGPAPTDANTLCVAKPYLPSEICAAVHRMLNA